MKILLIIDAQNYFVGKETLPVFKRIAEHIKESGKDYDFLAFTRHVNNKEAPLYKIIGFDELMGGKETEIWDGLKEFAKNVFVKDTYSIFRLKEFVEFLEKNKITKVYIAGFNLSACINTAMIDGLDCGFETFLLKNLVGDHYGKDKTIQESIKTNIGEDHVL